LGEEYCPEIEHVKVEAVPLELTSFLLLFYLVFYLYRFLSVYPDFTFYSVRPLLWVVVGGEGKRGVQFVSVKKTKRHDRDPTSYFIHCPSSSFLCPVYSEYKINTDGIEHCSL